MIIKEKLIIRKRLNYLRLDISKVMIWICTIPIVVATMFGAEIKGTERIIIMMDEYENYRRLAITLHDDSRINTQVLSNPKNGEFLIRQSPIDTSRYYGRRHFKESGEFPIQLTISFQDSQTILLTGKTVPFEKIVSYNVIEEKLYLFDIYKELPKESFFREKSITYSSETKDVDPAVNIRKNLEPLITPEYSTTQHQYFDDRTKSMLLSAIQSSSIIIVLAAIIFGFTKIIRLGNNSYSNKSKAINEQDEKKNMENITSTNIRDTEQSIRRLMESKSISYDEASILYNMGKGTINVKA